jgi:hypothetical protein
MSDTIDLKRLQDYFAPDDIEWKPIAVSKRTGKALAAAYVTSRAIQQRLDDVCGPANWRNEFMPGPNGGVLCGISVRVQREDGSAEWVTKWDGAENTEVESVKGGLSNAMKRAASHWGIGRYLYDVPQPWVPVDERGRFTQPPSIPAAFLPSGPAPQKAEGRAADAEAAAQRTSPRARTRSTKAAPNGRRAAPGADVDQYIMPSGGSQ